MVYLLFYISVCIHVRTTLQYTNSPFLSPEDILHAKQTFKKGTGASTNLDLRPEEFRNVAYWPNDQVMGKTYREMIREEEFGDQESPNVAVDGSKVTVERKETYDDYRWPNGKIPYKFIDDFSQKFKMLFAMQSYLFRLHTCIRFVPFDPKKHNLYLGIVQDDEGGCSANVGLTVTNDSKTPEMHMDDKKCRSLHDISHEMMHVLGFRHEHQRIDRDDYVRVFPDHILNGAEDEFVKGLFLPDRFRYMPYNTKSVMHYPSFAFAKSRLKTILALNGKHPIRNEITPMDYSRINLHYKCGHENEECKDLLTNDTCKKLGKGVVKMEGKHVEPVMLAEQAQCLNETFANFCKKTCGKCNQFSKRKHKTFEEWKKMKERKGEVDDSGAQESPMQTRMPCIDDEVHCKMWAENGLCAHGQSMELVRKWCPKSCKICDQTVPRKRKAKKTKPMKKNFSISQDILDLAEQVVDNSRPHHQLNKLSWKSKTEQRKDNGFSQFKSDQRMG